MHCIIFDNFEHEYKIHRSDNIMGNIAWYKYWQKIIELHSLSNIFFSNFVSALVFSCFILVINQDSLILGFFFYFWENRARTNKYIYFGCNIFRLSKEIKFWYQGNAGLKMNSVVYNIYWIHAEISEIYAVN